MTQLVQCCIFRGINALLTYELPEELSSNCTIGTHVYIPLGYAKAEGVIVDFLPKNANPVISKTKSILDLNFKKNSLSTEQIECIKWFSHFYQTTPFKAYQCIVGNRKKRDPISLSNTDITPSEHQLTPEQARTFLTISTSIGYSEHLIHGITGSGKTEIYMRLAHECIKNKSQIIICCPEISLTPQFRDQFRRRFSDHIIVLHSGLTPKQRDIGWESIKAGVVSVIIGPRSVMFSPVKKLGMIIIDEEHDNSYKQDTHPRYYTHDIAKWRCKYHKCSLVLGSATPSISTYLTTKKNVNTKDVASSYSYLANRASGSSLPSIEVVDMRTKKQSKHSLSERLIDLVSQKVDAKEKVILLLNRRGYAPYIQCSSCNTIHSCPECTLSFTYHQDKTFRCHRCDKQFPFTHTCSHCKRPHLAFGGYGIQKIELDVRNQFPKAAIVRLDKDTAKTATQMEAILTEFKSTGDILIGTQLIAKGHHIEDVTLVGVLGIDTQLNIPDFSSAENSFQLLMQVAGRAGRGKKPGHVVIQSSNPDHYAISCAKSHDYEAFVDYEAKFRSELNYPPFGCLTHIILSCTNLTLLKDYSKKCNTHLLKQDLSKHIQILGPKPSALEKARNHFRYSIIIKHFNSDSDTIRKLIQSFPSPPTHLRLITDFSPLHLL
jgi:primosomal protein N' (replication factor Y) (superfamily II helicase)